MNEPPENAPILAELDLSASEHDAMPYWMHPVGIAPYYATRVIPPKKGGVA